MDVLQAIRGMLKNVVIRLLFIFIFLSFHFGNAQTPAPNPADFTEVTESGGKELGLLTAQPNKRRIRRHLNLIFGVKHDEEILIPNIPLLYKGPDQALALVDITRIKDTDTFRITPKSVGNGIITIHNKTTGQIMVELRIDVREQTIEKTLREVQALLADIEGIEYKIVNGKILLDGYVLLPKELKRITQVIEQFTEAAPNSPAPIISSLVGLSPLAKKKIVEYIARDINNPEITVTSIGDFIKLEGFVNSQEEKDRINNLVLLYLPDIVSDKNFDRSKSVTVVDRKTQTDIGAYVINLIQIRKNEEREEPPPKMIQVVMHVVEYAERYLRSFNFQFSPSLQGLGAQQTQGQATAPGSISELAAIVDNLLPKLNWARTHGYVRLLDTASILVQDKSPQGGANTGRLSRTLTVNNGQTSVGAGGQAARDEQSYTLTLTVQPQIKSPRSELVEMDIDATTIAGGLSLQSPNTNVRTKVSVRSRQSAALAGIITKKSENQFGGPTGAGAIITLNHGKRFIKSSSNYVLFITPIVKSSASAGVEQVKKKFRFKD